MNEFEHLERLAETLTDALDEMSLGAYSAKSLEWAEEWTTIHTRLRNLRGAVVDRHAAERDRLAFRARFDTSVYVGSHGKEPAGRGMWYLLPLSGGGTPLHAEEVEYCGDIETLMNDRHAAFKLPDFPRFMICP